MRRFALLAALLLAPAVARANGRYPTPVDVHFQPGDHDVMALAMTWGLAISQDEGQTWGWICEGGVGFGGVFDPDYAFTSTGLLLATTTSADGLRLTRDFCSWDPAPPPLGSTDGGITPAKLVAQVEVGDDGRIYAAVSTFDDSQIYRSVDDGASFAAISAPGTLVDWWESLLVAPGTTGDTTRLYLAGFNLGDAGAKERLLFRSDNSGSTWTPLPVTDFTFGGDMSDLQLAAIDPDDPDLVFARVYQANGTTVGDAIYRSDDAGASWTMVFEVGDDVPAVLVRGNGEVVVQSRLSGYAVSADGGQTFGALVDAPASYCLRERDDGLLYWCGDGVDPDLSALSTGTAVGSYTHLLTFSEIDDQMDCAAGTDVAAACDQLWCGITAQFAIPGFEDECSVVDAGPADAGLVNPPPKTCSDCSGGGPASTAALAVIAVAPIVRRRRKKPAY